MLYGNDINIVRRKETQMKSLVRQVVVQILGRRRAEKLGLWITRLGLLAMTVLFIVLAVASTQREERWIGVGFTALCIVILLVLTFGIERKED